jgi:multiple sugar transport system permease protein
VLACAVVLAVAFSTGPFLWQVVTSVRPEGELTEIGLPSSPSLENYGQALAGGRLLRAMLNSTLVAGATTLVAVLLSASAAFVLAKLEIRGRRLLLGAVLLASMFPPVAMVSPLYLVLRALGLRDRLFGLVLPYSTFALPMTLWILTDFFRAIPDDVYRSAVMDGCSPFQALRRVMLPLVAPGLATTAVLVFISSWNEFLYALTFISSPGSRTVPVAISMFAGEHSEPWGEIAAGSVIATLPIILLAMLFQRWIVAGLTTGAVKG